MKELKVCWMSGGVSSLIAGYLAKDVDKYIYIHIENQHPDTLRFLKDCEVLIGKEIEIIQHKDFKRIEDVIRKHKWINSPNGARCTQVLKKEVRYQWEKEHSDYRFTYVWGYDDSEWERASRLRESFPEHKHEFPLIEKGMSKEEAHRLLDSLGIKRPMMYELGYSNNNCIGCVKGGMGYWNKIRKDFPDVFKQMCELEREVGHSCINGVFLDELEETRGRKEKGINL